MTDYLQEAVEAAAAELPGDVSAFDITEAVQAAAPILEAHYREKLEARLLSDEALFAVACKQGGIAEEKKRRVHDSERHARELVEAALALLSEEEPEIEPVAPDGAALIVAERRRQEAWRGGEGYSEWHDDDHDGGELAKAAVAYALPNDPTKISNLAGTVDLDVPRRAFFPSGWDFKPGDRIRELSKAGALIAAEIDRLQRLDDHTKTDERSSKEVRDEA